MPHHLATSLAVLGQADDGIFPDDAGSALIWSLMAAVILGLYFVVRNSRRKADRQYWEQSRREHERRLADPDMRTPED